MEKYNQRPGFPSLQFRRNNNPFDDLQHNEDSDQLNRKESRRSGLIRRQQSTRSRSNSAASTTSLPTSGTSTTKRKTKRDRISKRNIVDKDKGHRGTQSSSTPVDRRGYSLSSKIVESPNHYRGHDSRTKARRTHLQQAQKFATPSMLSLLSTVTGTTSSSSGSNTTVTQRSYSELSSNQEKRSSTKPRKRKKKRAVHKNPKEEQTLQPKEHNFSVFSYLQQPTSDVDEEHDAWQSDSSASDESSSEIRDISTLYTDQSNNYNPPSVTSEEEDAETLVADQIHDSGISVGSSSPKSTGNWSKRRKKLPVGTQSSLRETFESTGQAPEQENLGTNEKPWTSPSAPQYDMQYTHGYDSPYRYPFSGYPPQYPTAQSLPYYNHQAAQAENQYACKDVHTRGDTSNLAEVITAFSDEAGQSDGHLAPIYRRFEWLHNRLLLHLQNEIIRLEDKLKALDNNIATKKRRSSNSDPYGFVDENLEFQRTELLGQVFLKINQYNQSLSGYSSAVKEHRSPRSQEIESYRTWAQHNRGMEVSSLDNESDLIRVSRQSSDTVPRTRPDDGFIQWKRLALAAGSLVVLSLLTWVSLWLGKSFALLLIATISFGALYWTTFVEPLHAQDRGSCLALYVIVMVIVAATL